MSGGEWILLIGVVVLLAGLAYGLFTRTGSGITARPWGARGGAGTHPGAGEQAGAEGSEAPPGTTEEGGPPVDYGTR
jgi:hypothetical protein